MTDAALPDEDTPRDTKEALKRGWKRKCPSCGSGALFKGYLTVNHDCAVCGQEFHHHRADDGPAYLTILFVGHIMIILMHIFFVYVRPEPLVLFTVIAVSATLLSLYLLPRLKGATIAFQWARRMHGFDESKTGT